MGETSGYSLAKENARRAKGLPSSQKSRPQQTVKEKYDVRHKTEVYLRVATVTF